MKLHHLFIITLVVLLSACSTVRKESTEHYIVEITTFKFKEEVKPADYWEEDAKVENLFTSKQPGFISRESGYNSETNEVLVLVKWESQSDADASMSKFMNDSSVEVFAGMIDYPTYKMASYRVE
ncbi:MAG: hypothetical protein AAGC47_15025 [Bacteroidota bacterium]